MKELSLSKRIENWVKGQNRWVGGFEIERVVSENTNYKPSNSSRRCREMTTGMLSNGKTCPIVLEKKEMNGLTYYRWNPRPNPHQVDMAREVQVFEML